MSQEEVLARHANTLALVQATQAKSRVIKPPRTPADVLVLISVKLVTAARRSFSVVLVQFHRFALWLGSTILDNKGDHSALIGPRILLLGDLQSLDAL